MSKTPGAYTPRKDRRTSRFLSGAVIESLENRVLLTATPAVASFQVDGGAAQRSMVDSATLTFNQSVTLGANALTLTETATSHGISPGPTPFQISTPDGGTTYDITFPNSIYPRDIGSSLPNGTYDLNINAAAVTNSAGAAMAASVDECFYRLFGDFQGIGEVTFNNGFTPIVETYGQSVIGSNLPWYYDYDTSGSVGFPAFASVAEAFELNFAPTAPINPVSNVDALWPLTLSTSAASFGNNGDPLTYQWSVTDPAGAAITLPGAGAAPSETFTPSFAGSYSVSLTVADPGLGLSTTTQMSFYAFTPVYTLPASNPALPAGINAFTPPAINLTAPAVGFPQIGVSDITAGSGQSLSLTGSNLTAPGVGFEIYGQNGAGETLASVQIQDATANGDILTIPSTAPANSIYLLWPTLTGPSGTLYGAPIAINNTDPTWIGPNNASPGQTASVYGRNLSNGAATPQSWVYIQPATGTGEWAAVTAVNPYKVDFTVPSNLTPGQSYQVWINNGLGGQYSWEQAPGSLTIAAPTVYPGPGNVGYVNVMNGVTIQGTFYPGATGNGVTDDGPAIVNAIDYLESLPSGTPETLYFPTGTYVFDGEQINVPADALITGDGIGKTTLLFTALPQPDAQQENPWPEEIGTPDGGFNNIEFANMSMIYTGPAESGNALIRERYDSGLVINNVLLNAGSLMPLDWEDSTNLLLENSQLIGGPSLANVQNTSQTFINNDQFFLGNNAQESVIIWQADDISMTNCTTQDLDDADPATGMGQGVMVENGLVWGSIYNEYVGNNTTVNLGSDVTDSNDGTQINVEGNQVLCFGTIAAATCNSITLPISEEKSLPWPGDNVIVTAGSGVGELMTIKHVQVSATTITFTFSTHWNIQPDATSTVMVGTTLYNSVFYGNKFQIQSGTYGANLTGSAGIVVWEGAYNIAFDSNTMTNCYRGILLASSMVNSPCYFITLTNNTVDDTEETALFELQSPVQGLDFLPLMPSGDPNMIGVIARGNNVESALYSGVGLAQPYPTGDGSDTLTIIEGNTFSNTPIAIQLGIDPDTLIDNNTFDDSNSIQGLTEIQDVFAGATAILVNNTYLNFV